MRLTVDGDRKPCLFLVLIKKIRHLLDGFVMTSISTSKNDINTNSVLVDILHRFLRIKAVIALDGNRHKSALDLEISGEFLEGDLGVGSHDDIGTGFMDALPCCLALLLPDTLHG